jgi:hypothetical protein
MYRRRHHCRMCGQIFCNSCSSFSINGKIFNMVGLVRACRLCYEQQLERGDIDHKLLRQQKVLAEQAAALSAAATLAAVANGSADGAKTISGSAVPVAGWIAGGHCRIQETTESINFRSSQLQSRYVLLSFPRSLFYPPS